MTKRYGVLPCAVCRANVVEDQANVMVDSPEYLVKHRIYGLQVICKPCTRILDAQANGKERFHSMFELNELRHAPWLVVGEMLFEVKSQAVQTPYNATWDAASVDALIDIVIELLPEADAALLLKGYFQDKEWDGDGPRSEQFRRNREIE